MRLATENSFKRHTFILLYSSICFSIIGNAQNTNTNDLTFPAVATLKPQNGILKNGLYLMSIISTDKGELFMSSNIMNKEKKGGLSSEALTHINANKVNLNNDNSLWEFVMMSDSTFYIRSVNKNKYLYNVDKTEVSLGDKSSKNNLWKYSIQPDRRILIFTDNRERCLSRDYIWKNGFRCYMAYEKDADKEFSLYKIASIAYKGNCILPKQGDRLCFTANGKLKTVNSSDLNKSDVLLCDGTIAPTENLLTFTAEVLTDSTFQLRTKEGKYCNYNLQAETTPCAWKIKNGHLCTDETEPRYLCYNDGTWKQLAAEEAEELVEFAFVAAAPKSTINENGVCQLTGGWSANSLSGINLNELRCLDLTSISLPLEGINFQTASESNLPIFVNAADIAHVPASWTFVVSCSESKNQLCDAQLNLIDKKPFYTDRTIEVKASQIIYQRSATPSNSPQWQTLSLPFEAELKKGILYDCTSMENETLNFNEVTATTTSKGYLAKASGDGVLLLKSKACTIPAFSSSDVSQNESVLFPNYQPLTITTDNYYLLHPSLQNFVHAKSNSSLAPFRAYLQTDKSKQLKIRIKEH